MRAMRAKVDMESAPSAIEGRTREAGPSAPEAGSQPSTTAKSRISRTPDRKVGMLWPVSTTAASRRSTARPRQTAMAMPDRHPDPERDEERARGEDQRVGDARGDDVGGRHALHDRGAEIEAQEVAEVGEVLDEDRAVEAELAAQRLDMLARGALRHEEQRRVARQPHHEEDDREHAEASRPPPGGAG